MPFIDLETGVRLHYRDGGTGPTILFFPGFSATVDTWNYAVLDLHERFRCVCLDPRGHGLSDKPYSEYSFDEMCRDLRAFIHQLDLRDIALLGWSTGAGVALKYATEYDDGRVAKLVLVGPATPRFTQSETEPYGIDAQGAQASLEAIRRTYPETMNAFKGAGYHRTDLGMTQEWFLSHWLQLPAYAAYKYFRALVESDLRDNVGRVRIPTAIFHGRHDQVCDPRWAEWMAARIPGASLVWFEESGHHTMVEEPDKFSAELAKFVAG